MLWLQGHLLQIIKDGFAKGDLEIEVLPETVFLASQQGSYNHRHDGLGYRINKSEVNSIPPKRFDTIKISPLLKTIQSMRMKSRKKSLEIWSDTKNASDFDLQMEKHLYWLKLFTKINHYQRAIIRRIYKLVSR